MHVGIVSGVGWAMEGGPAVADFRTLEAIADLDTRNQYTVYELTKGATGALPTRNGRFSVHSVKPSGKLLGLAVSLPLELLRRPVDLLHATFVAPLVVPGKLVTSVTCWSQYERPDFYPPAIRWRLKSLHDRGIRRADAISCYTHFLKDKILEKFDLDAERIFVIPPGLGEEMRVLDEGEVNRFLVELQIRRPYILFIGKLTQRKNVEGLIRAFHLLREEGAREHTLVLLGERGFLSQGIFDAVRELSLGDHVRFVERRPHRELPLFYNGADLLVFPTFYEGFGMPPIEAMACGTPVVASNVTSVPEVVGDAARLADPHNIEDLAAAMHDVLADAALRATLVARGLERARQFSWRSTAQQTIAAYETIHRHPRR